mmetsp:Transcript_65119/g.187382  ORF Transcript_65119/g.187382 Transcript_65119/m.187382 type:complete len:247 (+) Transcript_65119:1294-2034(+)
MFCKSLSTSAKSREVAEAAAAPAAGRYMKWRYTWTLQRIQRRIAVHRALALQVALIVAVRVGGSDFWRRVLLHHLKPCADTGECRSQDACNWRHHETSADRAGGCCSAGANSSIAAQGHGQPHEASDRAANYCPSNARPNDPSKCCSTRYTGNPLLPTGLFLRARRVASGRRELPDRPPQAEAPDLVGCWEVLRRMRRGERRFWPDMGFAGGRPSACTDPIRGGAVAGSSRRSHTARAMGHNAHNR